MAAKLVAAIALSVIGGMVQAAGAAQAASAEAQYWADQSSIAQQNKLLAEQDRQNALQTAAQEAEDKRRENRRMLAGVRASYGATGFEWAGSPLDVLEDQSIEMALDVKKIEYEGQARARESSIRILGFDNESKQATSASKNALKAGKYGVGSALIGGATQAATIGYNASQAGA